MQLRQALHDTGIDAFYAFDPARLREATSRFVQAFPGQVLYAVKANPMPAVIATVQAAGVHGYDVASIGEVLRVRAGVPDARCCLMNPVKSRRDIQSAWQELGVREFALDCEAELDKLLDVLPARDDSVGVHLRFQPGAADAVYDLGSKFGAATAEAARLLRLIAAHTAWRTGLAFHPGSQTLSVEPYLGGLQTAQRLIEETGVAVATLDIGGGFPGRYDNMPLPPATAMLEPIAQAVAASPTLWRLQLVAEPGRALVHDCLSLFARVVLRKGDAVYCGAGIFSGLLPAQQFFQLPVRCWRGGVRWAPDAEARDCVVFGPTCDSNDRLAFAYRLPAALQEGDWIEFRHVGAYSESVRCAFNGFSVDHLVTVSDRELAP